MNKNNNRKFYRRREFSPSPERPTPLHKHQAFQNDNYEMLKLMLEKGVRETELTQCLREQCRRKEPRLDIIKLLIHHGAQIYDALGEAMFGNSPITLAIENEHVEVFKIFGDLLKTVEGILATSRPEAKFSTGAWLDGFDALEKAVASGNLEMCALLIELGVDVNFYNEESEGPLTFAPPDPPIVMAIQIQRLDIVKLLVENGAHLNSILPSRISALTLACLKGELEMVEYMLAYGANINALDVIFTPLHWAVHFKHTKLVRFLASNGASSTIKCKPNAEENNITPIEKTLGNKDIYHFKMLLYLNDF